MLRRFTHVVCLLACLAGCRTSEESPSCPGTSGCGPILPDGACDPGTMPFIGQKTCQPVGVLSCAPGFVADGSGGCDAILPREPCAPGKMAVPGDAECREVAPCGSGPFGDIPVEASTLYVDAAYLAGDGDGSKARPFPTIQAAVDAATSNPIIAVAAGTYVENVSITKPVRVVGRCPSMVEVKGSPSVTDRPTIGVTTKGEVSVRSIGVRGSLFGIAVRAGALSVEKVWVHDVPGDGLYTAGATASLVVRDSLVERTSFAAILAEGSVATVEATEVRDTTARASDGAQGFGIAAQVGKKLGSELTVRGSVVSGSTQFGIFVSGSSATVEATVVRETRSAASKQLGYGVAAAADPTVKVGSTLVLRRSLIERNVECGVFVVGSTATLDGTVVQDTQPSAMDATVGVGVQAEVDLATALRAEVTITGSVVRRNRVAGIGSFGATVLVEKTIVRDTLPQASDKLFGRGIDVIYDPATKSASALTVRSSLIDHNVDCGICVVASSATLESTAVLATQAAAADGRYGDGVAVGTLPDYPDARGSLDVTSSIVTGSARAGMSTFAADLSLQGCVLTCNHGPDLDREPTLSPKIDPSLSDNGANLCGCGGAPVACVAQTASLAPVSRPPPR